MLPTFFTNDGLRLIFFGGKGGTGKTTSAAASAVWLARARPSTKLLLVSMDPAHSLSDSLMSKFGDDARSLKELPNLFVREFDAASALNRFKSEHGRELKLIADRGTYFDEADINSFFDLSLPGIDEVMGVLEISDFLDGDEFSTVIIDTAPTGHTLSMLRLPAILDKWLGIFDMMEGKHKILQDHFSRMRRHDAADEFLESMHSRLVRLNQRLCDALITEFVVVTIPEAMVILETERMLSALYEQRIPVHTLIVNRTDVSGECAICTRHKSLQMPMMEKLETKSFYKKIYVPRFTGNVRGLDAISVFASWLAGRGVRDEGPATTTSAGRRGTRDEGRGTRDEGRGTRDDKDDTSIVLATEGSGRPSSIVRLPIAVLDKMRFIMVSGKGGVGKTTTAAATAIAVAKRHPEKKIRLYSIDPAHSLGDCFDRTIGDRGVTIFRNLEVFELDADKLYSAFREKFETAVADMFDRYTGSTERSSGIDFGQDRELLNELMSMSPPGLDELMALHKVTSALNEVDCVIYDTAPTGHFVRFLELPKLVRGWLNATFEMLLKYHGVVHMGDIAQMLVNLSRDVRSVMDIMSDHSKSSSIAVTIPEPMAVEETGRLIDALHANGVRCAGIVVNMVTESEGCPFCHARASGEVPCLKRANDMCRDVAVVPYLAEDLRGVHALCDFGKRIFERISA